MGILRGTIRVLGFFFPYLRNPPDPLSRMFLGFRGPELEGQGFEMWRLLKILGCVWTVFIAMALC